jgi:hypothetical protein
MKNVLNRGYYVIRIMSPTKYPIYQVLTEKCRDSVGIPANERGTFQSVPFLPYLMQNQWKSVASVFNNTIS